MAFNLNKRIKVDWPSVVEQNKGIFAVERDYQFPGGFYVRHKGTPYFLSSRQYDIELMVENALAALNKNTGPIILPNEDEVKMVMDMTSPVMELLDKKLPSTSGWYLNFLWNILNTVTVHPRALSLDI